MTWYRLVGTSHIARQSTRRIRDAARDFQPDAFAVELDRNRLAALVQGERPSYSPRLVRVIGVRGYLFALLGSFVQRRLGRIVNMAPGSDMLAAVNLAKEGGKRLVLIDQDIRVTLQRLNKSLGWREFLQFCKDLWEGVVHRKRYAFDLSKVPEERLVVELLSLFRKRYPRPYRALVGERNHHMARALRQYHQLNPEEKVLVVVGAGHAPGMRSLLEGE